MLLQCYNTRKKAIAKLIENVDWIVHDARK